jgi:uncharacterized protein YqeY
MSSTGTATDPQLKARLHDDMTAAMKSRNEVALSTLRMVLTAITNEEVAGASVRELADDEVLRVLAKEAKKRREAAEAFDQAGRVELADRERAEGDVIAGYLPQQLTPDEIVALVTTAISDAGATSMRDMGSVMKLATPRAGGRADGAALSAEIRRQLG